MRTDLSLETLTHIDALERLWPEWSRLWGEAPGMTPFQSPEWLIPWWRHIGVGELRTLALWSRGRLVGLLPLYIHRSGQLFPLGIATTDYLDALLAPGWETEGMRALFAGLATHQDGWEWADFPQLRPTSPLLRAPAPPGWREERGEAEPCPALELPPRLPAQMAQNLRTYRRRAERAGTLRLIEADRANIEELLEAHITLHRDRWRSRGQEGVLADGVERAYRESAQALLALGVLRLYALELDGRIIATLHGLIDRPARRRRFYCYLGGFDPAFGHLSPGTLIIGLAMERAGGEGVEVFDFLRGRDRYKYLWGASDRPTWRRRLWPGDG